MPQFDFATYPSQFLWLFISFAIVFFGVFYLVLPKYNKILDLRVKKIQNEIDTALYLQKEVIRLKKNRLKRIAQSEMEAKILVEDAYKKILQNQSEQLKYSKKQHEEMIVKFEKSIEAQKQIIVDNIQPFIDNSVEDIVAKFLEEEIVKRKKNVAR